MTSAIILSNMRERIQKMANKRVVALFVALLVVVSGTFGVVRAQTPGGSGLQISPTRTELSVNPGEVKDFSVTVKNVTQGDITVTTVLNDFTPDESGEPKLVVDNEGPKEGSLKQYLKGVEDFDLKAGETKEVKYSVDFPPNASAGAYYGAVRYVALPKGAERDTAQRQVALNASVASLILVQLEGNIIESVQINKIEVRRDDKPGSFFTTKPNKLAIDVKNKGNGFSKPFGKVQILGMNGSEVYSYELNSKDPRGNVLPGSNRVFVDDLQGIKTPGRYTAIANVSYGQGGDIITQKVSFWYVPWWLVGVLFGLIALIGGGVYWFVRKGGRVRRVRKF